MAMLEIKDLEVNYGVIHAIKGVSFTVNQGEVIALVGANGAGKTTILHTISGLIPAKKGSILFEGQELTKMPAHKIVSMGMAHVPEGRRIFQQLTVLENLKLGAYTRSDKKEIAESLGYVYSRFPRLEERKNQIAGTLSGGEQQMLAMGRALMSRPRIILMPQPSSATRILSTPPPSISTSTWVAPESRALSRSSRRTAWGLSMTSPAAIRRATEGFRTWIWGMGELYLEVRSEKKPPPRRTSTAAERT